MNTHGAAYPNWGMTLEQGLPSISREEMRPMEKVAACLALCVATATPLNAMDRVRQVTRTDLAVAKYGVTGKGVTVAILDRGIDWRHPDFIKPDGTTRIKWILDMSGQNLCGPGIPPGPGSPPPVEYTEAQINAALSGGPTINTRDAVGHGTATAGIAAGNGRALPSGLYKGMAPEANLIIVKVTSEGAPAHDTETAETAFQGCLEQALDWLDAKVTALGQPVVALINSGTQWGPIDGTSAVSRKIDQVFGSNRPGRVYVAAGGDEGGLTNHAGGTYTSAGDTVVAMSKASATTTYMQVWYTGSIGAQVTVTFADGTTVGPVGPGGSISASGVTIYQYAPGNEFYPWQSTSGDRAVWIQLGGNHAGPGTISIRGTQAVTGYFDVYSDVWGPNLTPIVSFTDHVVTGRLTDYAATASAIVAANYVDKTSWTDVDGFARSITNEGAVDHLWSKSPYGPTRDGRTFGIDVTPPGQNCFAPSAQNSYWHTLRYNLVQNGNGYYVRAGGTSGSAPILTGAVALLLQLRPTLTASQVRALLRGSASADAFTGPVPTPFWGFGKLDVLAALDAADLIHRDGFESGTLSGWSSAATGGGDLAVSATAAMAGTSLGLRALVNDTTPLYVQDDTPAAEGRYRARFYFDPSGFDPGEGSSHFRTRTFIAFDPSGRRALTLVLKRQNGAYSVEARVRRDDGSRDDTGFLPIGSGPHHLELDWRRATAPGAVDGSLQLWIDGVSAAMRTGIDNDQSAIESARLGAISLKTGAAGTLRFDEFESRRYVFIGP